MHLTPTQKRCLARAVLGERVYRAGGFGGRRRNPEDEAAFACETTDALMRKGLIWPGPTFNSFVATDAGRDVYDRFRGVWI